MPRKAAVPAAGSLYSVHPSIAYARSVITNLEVNTGRSLDEWLALIEKSGPAGEDKRRDWLKKAHKLGGTTAWMIAEFSEGKGQKSIDDAAYLNSAIIQA